MIKKVCPICGQEFNASNKKRVYCSRKCFDKRNQCKVEIKDDYAEIVINSPRYGEMRTRIDINDINKVKDYTWSVARFSGLFYINNNTIGSMHRYIMNCPKDKVIDHINHDTLDNRKANLRVVTQLENTLNTRPYKTNKSGVLGVCEIKYKSGKIVYCAFYRNRSIGHYKTIEEAIHARRQAEILDKENTLKEII